MTNGSTLLVDIGNIGSVSVTSTNLGSVRIASTILGSVYILSDPVPVSGGVIVRAGSIQTYSPLGVGSVVISGGTLGSVAITTIPLPISGIGLGIAGSVRQTEIPWEVRYFQPAQNVSGVSYTGSFTGSVFITPGVGSKLIMRGFNASAEIATKFQLRFSGGTSTNIGTFILPNSGTMAMNMLGMEPSGATNQPLMVNLLNAGSLFITGYTKDSL